MLSEASTTPEKILKAKNNNTGVPGSPSREPTVFYHTVIGGKMGRMKHFPSGPKLMRPKEYPGVALTPTLCDAPLRKPGCTLPAGLVCEDGRDVATQGWDQLD
jgi:hypothetical protein